MAESLLPMGLWQTRLHALHQHKRLHSVTDHGTQMTKLLDLLDAFLDERGHRACRIDGSVAWQDR